MESASRNRLTEADRALWAHFASRVSPLPGRQRPAACCQEPVVASERPSPMPAVRMGYAPHPALVIGVPPGGVDRATWQRFRKGRFEAARTLDLHGLTVHHAFHAFSSFLRKAHAEGLRCVEVVTGQSGVLRRELPLWLDLPELRGLVLAAAHPHAANPGAVRLLLRRAR